MAEIAIIALLYAGISLFRRPGLARLGNLAAALALAAGAALILVTTEIHAATLLAAAVGLGAVLGLLAARRTTMLHIPGMVAFQHGAGGLAALLVSAIELERGADDGLLVQGVVAGHLGLLVGAATFSASLIASGKLLGRLKPRPTVLPGHGRILLAVSLVAVALAAAGAGAGEVTRLAALVVEALLAALAGVLLAVRIGGADMPVLISFLNASAGFAASFCGIVLGNHLLIAFGAVVAASGSILTLVMCRAMNRSLLNVFVGLQAAAPTASPGVGAPVPTPAGGGPLPDPVHQFCDWARAARSIIVIPGYGMAVAQAQAEVAKLASRLQAEGKRVRFAIHPVAGRMPGHMNVLLAEADVDYDLLVDLEDINPDFRATDLVVVVGACDVVNPAAMRTEGTPISGMPILLAHEAAHVAVFNLDATPGYSGVPNDLYDRPGVALIFGHARETLRQVLDALAPSP